MVNGGIQVAWLLIRQMIVGATYVGIAIAFLALVNLAVSGFIGINGGVLGDIFAIVQIWLPFNLSAVVAWCVVATAGFLSYKTAVIVHNVSIVLLTKPV